MEVLLLLYVNSIEKLTGMKKECQLKNTGEK